MQKIAILLILQVRSERSGAAVDSPFNRILSRSPPTVAFDRVLLSVRDFVETVLTYFSNLLISQKELLVHG